MLPPKPKQNCSTCPNQIKCWSTHTNKGNPISTQNVLINVLICRLQLGIQRDDAAKNLIKLYRPGMIRLLTHAKQSGNIIGTDMDQLLQDMQSTMIEYLLYDYKIGDRGRATPYLFDPHQGFLTKWVKWVVGKNRRFYLHHELFSPLDEHSGNGEDGAEVSYHAEQISTQDNASSSWGAILEGTGSMIYNPYAQEDTASTMVKQIVDIIDDGITLNSNEYRVMRFCLTNSNESNNTRHIDGLHIYLGRLMGVSRPRITRLYKRAKDKIKKRHLELEALEEV